MILIGSYWLFYPYKILEFSDPVFPVLTKTVKAGEQVQYRARYCKYMPIGFTVTRKFIDGIIYTVPSVESNNPTGCHDNVVYIEVPKNIPAGEFTLEMLYRVKINPIRTIDIIMNTEKFNVVK